MAISILVRAAPDSGYLGVYGAGSVDEDWCRSPFVGYVRDEEDISDSRLSTEALNVVSTGESMRNIGDVERKTGRSVGCWCKTGRSVGEGEFSHDLNE